MSIARTQAVGAAASLTLGDMEVVLALVRGRTLAEAAARLGADPFTVFRSLQRIEKALGQRLFERGRAGYLPSEGAAEVARHAERVEAELEAARSALSGPAGSRSSCSTAWSPIPSSTTRRRRAFASSAAERA